MTTMPKIRRCRRSDVEPIWSLVTAVVSEVYGPIFPAGFRLERDTDWSPSWVADIAGNVVAVMLTEKDWLEDLWIGTNYRGRGVGGRLLARAERDPSVAPKFNGPG